MFTLYIYLCSVVCVLSPLAQAQLSPLGERHSLLTCNGEPTLVAHLSLCAILQCVCLAIVLSKSGPVLCTIDCSCLKQTCVLALSTLRGKSLRGTRPTWSRLLPFGNIRHDKLGAALREIYPRFLQSRWLMTGQKSSGSNGKRRKRLSLGQRPKRRRVSTVVRTRFLTAVTLRSGGLGLLT